jgi:hypothetical protein
MNDEQVNANNDHDKIFMEYFCHMDKILDYVEVYFVMLTYLMIIWKKNKIIVNISFHVFIGTILK